MESADILTPEEAAAILRISTRKIYDLLREGKVPGKKIGGQWRITREQLFEYFKEAR